MEPAISIIIPTLNEENYINHLLTHLLTVVNRSENLVEIIVVDGGSSDHSTEIALSHKVILLHSSLALRAAQMNIGALKAQYNILYFVHADTLPPSTFIEDIQLALSSGYEIGCYRSKFDAKNHVLRFNAWTTRFNLICFRGGDQSLFIRKSIFQKISGFNEVFTIMEEYDLIIRARPHSKFKVIAKEILISTRKYSGRSYFKVNIINLIAFSMFQLKFAPNKIRNFYHKHL